MTHKTPNEPLNQSEPANQAEECEPLVLDGNPPEPKASRFLGKSASMKIDAEVAENLRTIEEGIRRTVAGVSLTAADLFRHAASVAAEVYSDREAK